MKTEAGKDRAIPIYTTIKPIVEQWYNRCTTVLLFNSIDGINHDANNFRERDYYPFMQSIGISEEVNPHCCRHTFASIAVTAGMPAETLKKIMGHAKYETTNDYYTHVDISQILSSSDIMNLTAI